MSRGYEDEYGDEYGDEERGPLVPPEGQPPASAGKIMAPGIALIVTGVLSVLGALGLLGAGFSAQHMPPAEFEKQLEQQNPAQFKQMQDMGYSAEAIQNIAIKFYFVWGGLSLLGALLSIVGGACMCARKARGLGFVAAFANLIPCVLSPCCILGVPVGLWALIVLFQGDVKAAFR